MHVDHPRRCRDRYLEMIALHDIHDVARSVRDDIHAIAVAQAVIQQPRASRCTDVLAKSL